MDDISEQIFELLSPEQREELAALPRAERVGWLLEELGGTEASWLSQLAAQAGLPVLEKFSVSDRPEDALPIRLIHEYQCLPIVLPQHHSKKTTATDDTASTAPHTAGKAGAAATADSENIAAGSGGVGAESAVSEGAASELAAAGDEPLHLVTLWPVNAVMSNWVRAATGRQPHWYLALCSRVAERITQAYGVGSGSLDEQSLEGFAEQENEEKENEDAALIRFVNEVIAKAITDRATDIHFEPQKETLNIRYRIDGELVPVRVPDNLKTFQRAILSRLKIMARLNISERRRPQDGRIGFTAGGEDLDIRISTLPTMYGESVSLRLLSNKGQPVSVEDLGFLKASIALIDATLARPHGIVLATGPTGAGKSTTLSAFIRKIRDPRRRIITIEDPVEYEIEGVNQTQVHSEIGLTFANSLRSVLRQDPDVIMVGEIRDRETADIAIRASLTGHLVLSTLHTNDAPGAITRLIDMDIEPFLIASSVEMVIAQRLVRRLCPHCARPANLDEAAVRSALLALHIEQEEIQFANQILEAAGCEQCRNLGYRGRVGIFEILRMSDAIHEQIVKRSSAWEIRQVAEKLGMSTLQRSGWEQVKRGITTLEEIMRYADIIEQEQQRVGEETAGTPQVADKAAVAAAAVDATGAGAALGDSAAPRKNQQADGSPSDLTH